MQKVYEIHNSIDAELIPGRTNKETIWWNKDANEGDGAWQTLAYVKDGDVFGLKIYEQSNEGTWQEATILNPDSPDIQGPDNFILIMNVDNDFRYEAGWSKSSGFQGTDTDFKLKKMADDGLSFDESNFYNMDSGGNLHVIFYDKGYCSGTIGSAIPVPGHGLKKIPGIYHMSIQFFKSYETRKGETDESPVVHNNIFVKNFDYVNSSINDRGGEKKGLSLWKNHHLIAPIFRPDDGWKEIFLDAGIENSPALTAIELENNPMDECTFDVASLSRGTTDISNYASADQETVETNIGFFDDAVSLRLSFLAKIKTSTGNVTWDRLCHTTAICGNNTGFSNGQKGPYWTKDDVLIDTVGATSQRVLDWMWGHTRTDIDIINGSFGSYNKSQLINSMPVNPSEISGPGQLSTGYYHEKTFFGPRAGFDNVTFDSDIYWINTSMGMAPNRWMAITDWSRCHLDLIGTASWNEFLNVNDECFKKSLTPALMRLPQAMMVVDQNMTREDYLSEIYSGWVLQNDYPRILGFDYATDPRDSEQRGFWAYTATKLPGTPGEISVDAGVGYYINVPQTLTSPSAEGSGVEGLTGNYGSVFYEAFWQKSFAHTISMFDNPIATSDGNQTIDTSRRRALKPEVTDWGAWLHTSEEGSFAPETDSNYVYNTSSFSDSRGATNKISIAVSQQNTFGFNYSVWDDDLNDNAMHSIMDKTFIFIAGITADNHYRGSKYTEMVDGTFHNYHGDENLMSMNAGRNIRLFKMLYLDEIDDYMYSSELLNLGKRGSLPGPTGDYTFGIWDRVQLQVDYGGDSRFDFITDQYTGNQIDEIKASKVLNIYASTNCGGIFDNNADGYNMIEKHTLDLLPFEDEFSVVMFTSPTYIADNLSKTILYDLGTTTSKIFSFTVPDGPSIIDNFNQKTQYLENGHILSTGKPKSIPLIYYTNYSLDSSNTLSTNIASVTWHNYHKYFDTSAVTDTTDATAFKDYCFYSSIKNFNVNISAGGDFTLIWKTPWIIYTRETIIGGDYEKISALPTSYTIKRSSEPIFDSNFNAAETVAEEVIEGNVVYNANNYYPIQQDPGVNYFYAIRMNFEMPVYEIVDLEYTEPTYHTVHGVISTCDSVRGIKDVDRQSFQVESTSKYAAMEKNEDKVHVGLGSTVTDTPKWIGIPGNKFLGSEQTEVQMHDAELKSPDLGTGIPALTKFFQIDGEENFIYGYVKNEPHLYRISKTTGFTEKSNKILNPNGTGDLRVTSVCQKMTDNNPENASEFRPYYIWLYSIDDIQRVHTFYIKDAGWAGLTPMANLDGSVGLPLRFKPENTPWQNDETGSISESRSVFADNSYFNISDMVETYNGTSYKLWFMITPKDEWYQQDVWHNYQIPEFRKRGWMQMSHHAMGDDSYNTGTASLEYNAKWNPKYLFNATTTINRRETPHSSGTFTFDNSSEASQFTGEQLYGLELEDKTPSMNVTRIFDECGNWSGDNGGYYNNEVSDAASNCTLDIHIKHDRRHFDIFGRNPHTDNAGEVYLPGMDTSVINPLGRMCSHPDQNGEWIDNWMSSTQIDTTRTNYCNYIELGQNIGPVYYENREGGSYDDAQTQWGLLVLKDTLVDLTKSSTMAAGHKVGFFCKGYGINYFGRLNLELTNGQWHVEDMNTEGDKNSRVEFTNGKSFMYIVHDNHKGVRNSTFSDNYPKLHFQQHRTVNGFMIKSHSGDGDYSAGPYVPNYDFAGIGVGKDAAQGCYVQIRYGNSLLDNLNLITDTWSVAKHATYSVESVSSDTVTTDNEREIFICTSDLSTAGNWQSRLQIIRFTEEDTDAGGSDFIRKYWDGGTSNVPSYFMEVKEDSSSYSTLLSGIGGGATITDVNNNTVGEDIPATNLELYSSFAWAKVTLPKLGPAHRNEIYFIFDKDTNAGSGAWADGDTLTAYTAPGEWAYTKNFKNSRIYRIPINTTYEDGSSTAMGSDYNRLRHNFHLSIARQITSILSTSGESLNIWEVGTFASSNRINILPTLWGYNEDSLANILENGGYEASFGDVSTANWAVESIANATTSKMSHTTFDSEDYQKPVIIVDRYKQNFSSAEDYEGYILGTFGDTAFGKFTADAHSDVASGTTTLTINAPLATVRTGIDLSVAEPGASNDTSQFKDDTIYRYKMSFTYDRRQESPLSSKTWSIEVDGNSNKGYETIKVKIKIDPADFIERINRVNVYRIDDENDIYRLVKSIKTDIGFSVSGGLYESTFYDSGKKLVSYEALNGISENITRNIVHWELSTQINNEHIVAKCFIPETNEEVPNFIFKSKMGKFDQFDWSNDYGILPTIPTAIKAFAGKIFAWDRNNTYIIDPTDLRVIDTIEGTGCIGPRAVVVTDFGMAFFDDSNVYLHDGQMARPIALTIQKSNSGFVGWEDRENKDKLSITYSADKKQFIIFETSRLISYSEQTGAFNG